MNDLIIAKKGKVEYSLSKKGKDRFDIQKKKGDIIEIIYKNLSEKESCFKIDYICKKL